MPHNFGCCASLIRFVLGALNTLVFLGGIALFTCAAMVRWNLFSLGERYDDVSSLDCFTLTLLVVAGFTILVSLFGLVGVCCLSKCCLVLHEIIVGVLFLGHLVLLGVFMANRGDIKASTQTFVQQDIVCHFSRKTPRIAHAMPCMTLACSGAAVATTMPLTLAMTRRLCVA